MSSLRSLATAPAAETLSDVGDAASEPRGFFGLPREIRDMIYNLLDRKVEQSLWCRFYGRWYSECCLQRAPRGCFRLDDESAEEYLHARRGCEHDEEFIRSELETTAPISQLRLINKQFKQEYEHSYKLSNKSLKISAEISIEKDWQKLDIPSSFRRCNELKLDLVASLGLFGHQCV